MKSSVGEKKPFRVDKVFMVAGTNENTSSWQTCEMSHSLLEAENFTTFWSGGGG